MRDPDARLQFTHTEVIRLLSTAVDRHHFLCSKLAERWVSKGWMLPFEVRNERTVTSPRVPFVALPGEWTDGQFFEAARLTLELQTEAVEAGFDLKDASAWNVIFVGNRAVLCDHLSPVGLTQQHWWAAGQFSRHFVLPLWLSQARGLRASECLQLWRDGVQAQQARAILGVRAYFHRCLPLLSEGRGKGRASQSADSASAGFEQVASFRRRLQKGLSWMLDGVGPAGPSQRSSRWSGYEREREHYVGGSVGFKRAWIAAVLERLKPSRVVDLGCNAGEFSEIAWKAGAEVVAIDADHDCVHRLRTSRGSERVTTVVAVLDDLPGARGWAGAEFPSLNDRLEQHAEMVMMLGLIHHLAIAGGVPLDMIASWLYRLTKRWAVIEWIDADDVQATQMLGWTGRSAEEFSVARQRLAFDAAGFVVVDAQMLPGLPRTLALLERSA